MAEAKLSAVLDFLVELDTRKIYYQLRSARADALMVEIVVPGERWEVEFMVDGSLEVERFLSDGHITGSESIQELFDRFSD